jgi:hypothetical protein
VNSREQVTGHPLSKQLQIVLSPRELPSATYNSAQLSTCSGSERQYHCPATAKETVVPWKKPPCCQIPFVFLENGKSRSCITCGCVLMSFRTLDDIGTSFHRHRPTNELECLQLQNHLRSCQSPESAPFSAFLSKLEVSSWSMSSGTRPPSSLASGRCWGQRISPFPNACGCLEYAKWDN